MSYKYPSATSSNDGVIKLTGDFGGTHNSPKTVGLQGRELASFMPQDGYVISWSNINSRWEPARISGVNVNPDFGSQNITTSGSITSGSIVNTSTTTALISLTGKLVVNAITTSTVAGPDQGVIYFDGYTNKFKVSEDGGSYLDLLGANGSASGDLTGTYPSPTVAKLQGHLVSSQSLSATQDGYILTWSNSDGYWKAKNPNFGSLNITTTGALTSGQIVSTSVNTALLYLSGKIVADPIYTSTVSGPDQGVIYFDGYTNKFKVSEDGGSYVDLVGGASGSAGGDLSGTYPNPTVAKIQNRSVASTAPTDGYALLWSQSNNQWQPGQITSSIPDATASVKGALKLTSDLGGTADLPLVNKLQGFNLGVNDLAAKSITVAPNMLMHTVGANEPLGVAIEVVGGGQADKIYIPGLFGVYKVDVGTNLYTFTEISDGYWNKTTNQHEATIFADNSLWVGDDGYSRLLRLNKTTFATEATINFGSLVGSGLFTNSLLTAVPQYDNSNNRIWYSYGKYVVKVNPTNNTVDGYVDLSPGTTYISSISLGTDGYIYAAYDDNSLNIKIAKINISTLSYTTFTAMTYSSGNVIQPSIAFVPNGGSPKLFLQTRETVSGTDTYNFRRFDINTTSQDTILDFTSSLSTTNGDVSNPYYDGTYVWSSGKTASSGKLIKFGNLLTTPSVVSATTVWSSSTQSQFTGLGSNTVIATDGTNNFAVFTNYDGTVSTEPESFTKVNISNSNIYHYDLVSKLAIRDQYITSIRGRNISATAPIDGYVLTWVNSNSQWEPKASAATKNRTITNVSDNYTVLTTDDLIAIGSLAAPKTMTLPLSPSSGDKYEFKDTVGEAATRNITISGNGNNIDGSSTYVIDQNYGSLTVVYTGSRWSII
jgi:hypothetical protein